MEGWWTNRNRSCCFIENLYSDVLIAPNMVALFGRCWSGGELWCGTLDSIEASEGRTEREIEGLDRYLHAPVSTSSLLTSLS